MTADLLAVLDQLDEAHAKATPGPWRQAFGDIRAVEGQHLLSPAIAVGPDGEVVAAPDAALIVAAVNALPALTAAVRAALALADEYERETAERKRVANATPCCDAATRIRSVVADALTEVAR